jgi:murein DD-endopeptidase MepM/ murein hydrolase activator NlpD
LGGLVIVESVYQDDTYFMVYGHMAAVAIKEGEKVEVNAFLGRQGNTGKSAGAHLHFGLNRNGTLDVATGEITGGEWLNPLIYMEEPSGN